MTDCPHLQALFLNGNHIMTRDLCYMINISDSLRKLDLSHNKIVFPPDHDTFEKMIKLEFLFLHFNQIMGWAQVESIMAAENLHVLSL